MKYRKLTVLNLKQGTSPAQVIKWLRRRDDNLTLQCAIDWIKNLPQTFDNLGETEYLSLCKELQDLVQYEVEILKDTSYSSFHYSREADGLVEVSRYSEELKDAETWLDNLSELDKARVQVLCSRWNGPVG